MRAPTANASSCRISTTNPHPSPGQNPADRASYTRISSAANAPAKLITSTPTRKLPPTSYWLPTLTPNPFYTPPVFETSTPFVLANGPLPSIIGFSLTGRPIEAYSFGDGEREYLIVAGIHGGSEWNTIALANELITYINEHPDIIAGDTTLYIIRNMNPDGEARSHGVDGRVNNNGVDLNRNFPTETGSRTGTVMAAGATVPPRAARTAARNLKRVP